jgi:hypothetical protein
MASTFDPGELLALRVTFVEDGAGRAVVRLPNGSKTTLDHDCLRAIGGSVHFVRGSFGSTETAHCVEQGCGWSRQAATREAAEDVYVTHLTDAHPASLRATVDGGSIS